MTGKKEEELKRKNDLARSYCFAVCAHGAAALADNNKELKELMTRMASHIVFNHCLIQRQALVAKDIDEKLRKILQDVIIVINYIKGSNEMDSEDEM